MNKEKALKILSDHNKWRRGDDSYEMADPKELGEAIDFVVNEEKPVKVCIKGVEIESVNCVDCGKC